MQLTSSSLLPARIQRNAEPRFAASRRKQEVPKIARFTVWDRIRSAPRNMTPRNLATGVYQAMNNPGYTVREKRMHFILFMSGLAQVFASWQGIQESAAATEAAFFRTGTELLCVDKGSEAEYHSDYKFKDGIMPFRKNCRDTETTVLQDYVLVSPEYDGFSKLSPNDQFWYLHSKVAFSYYLWLLGSALAAAGIVADFHCEVDENKRRDRVKRLKSMGLEIPDEARLIELGQQRPGTLRGLIKLMEALLKDPSLANKDPREIYPPQALDKLNNEQKELVYQMVRLIVAETTEGYLKPDDGEAASQAADGPQSL